MTAGAMIPRVAIGGGLSDAEATGARAQSQGPLIPVLEIGGTHVTAAHVAMRGRSAEVVSVNRLPLDSASSATALIDTFVAAGRSLEQSGSEEAWGVAIPGPFDYERGVAHFTGVAKFDELRGINLGEALTRGLWPRMRTVTFVNDATAFALGEDSTGAGRRHRRVVYLTMGTGIGSAFVADGHVVDSGPTVPERGWVYLIEWDGKPLEETVSRRAIRSAYKARAGELLDVREMAERARGGEPAAAEILTSAVTALGDAIGPWARSFGATAVVVGGSMTGSWDLIGGPLSAALRQAAAIPELLVLRARLGDDAALIGAAKAAIYARTRR